MGRAGPPLAQADMRVSSAATTISDAVRLIGASIVPRLCRNGNETLEAIVFKRSATFGMALAILAASGCATYPARDPALDDARLSLEAARRNPQVAVYAPMELDQAAATLRQAEELAAGGGRYGDSHRLA